MTDREHEILKILKKNPTITHEEIANKLFVTRSTVSVHITNLIEKGYIKGRGYIFNEDYIVCIGSANVDITGFATAPLIQKDKNPNSNIEISVGGVARNIGENLARMGTKVTMLTAVGDDLYGDLVKNESEKAGMITEDILTVKGKKSCLYISINGPDRDLSIGMTDMALTSEIDDKYLISKADVLKGATAIVISPCIPKSGFDYLQKQFSDKPIFVDVAAVDYAKKVLEHIEMFHTIKANEHEIEALTGIKVVDNKSLERAANKIIAKGVQNIFITLGADGTFYKNNKGVSLRKKAFQIDEIISSTGAGDAFMSGIVYSFLQRFNESKSIKFAQVAASFALKSNMAINKEINAGEILKLMRDS